MELLKNYAQAKLIDGLQLGIEMPEAVFGYQNTFNLSPTEELQEVFIRGSWLSQMVIATYMRYFIYRADLLFSYSLIVKLRLII